MTLIASARLSQAAAARLSDAIREDPELGSAAIDAREKTPSEWEIVIYLDDGADDQTRARLRDLAESTVEPHAPEFVFRELPDTDWVAKSLEGLAPVRAGRFVVHGAHDRDKVRANEIGIEIEAGQAFGTGHHGTTAGCLLAIDRLAKTRHLRRALDLGTGSGVLAIAIAKACKTPVLASDIDPVAVRIARENAELNGVAGYVTVVAAAGLAGAVFRGAFDLVVANILAGPLTALAPAIRRVLAPRATVVLSGLLPHQRARIVAAYRGQGLRLVRDTVLEDWLTLVFERPGQRG